MPVIIVVEGPVGSGKTSWCNRQVGRFVADEPPTGLEPVDGTMLARHWARIAMRRWAQAQELERFDDLAFCDTDPVRLHHSWGLSVMGLAPRAQFERELAVTRVAFQTRRLGFADAVLVGEAPEDAAPVAGPVATGGSRRIAQVRLREPLRRWYAALDEIDPGRVIWELPVGGLPEMPAPRADRCSLDLLDALVDALPDMRGVA